MILLCPELTASSKYWFGWEGGRRKDCTPLWNQNQEEAWAALGKHPCPPPPALSLLQCWSLSPPSSLPATAAPSSSVPSLGHFWTANLRTNDGQEEDEHCRLRRCCFWLSSQPFCLLWQKKQRVGIPSATGRISSDPPCPRPLPLLLLFVDISLLSLVPSCSLLFLSRRKWLPVCDPDWPLSADAARLWLTFSDLEDLVPLLSSSYIPFDDTHKALWMLLDWQEEKKTKKKT